MGVHRELEITVLSAQNLKNAKHTCFGTMNPYAVLWIDSNSKASTHVSERGGRSPSWNCVIRLLCTENLFGKIAKSKLIIEVYDYKPFRLTPMKVVGTAAVLLSELQANLVRAGNGGAMSEPKRMTLEVRRFRKGSYQREVVIGRVEIQVRLGRGWNQADAASGGVDGVLTYNGIPIETPPGHEMERDDHQSRDFHAFNVNVPAPIQPGQAAPVYYQHAYVEKPRGAWRGIFDARAPGSLGVLAMGIAI